jgi:hypothetical protein
VQSCLRAILHTCVLNARSRDLGVLRDLKLILSNSRDVKKLIGKLKFSCCSVGLDRESRMNLVSVQRLSEVRKLQVVRAVIFTCQTPLGGHEFIFLAMSGLRKEFGVILTVAVIFLIHYLLKIFLLYSVL